MISKEKLPANDAGKRQYNSNKLVRLHSKYIPTFKPHKLKKNGKINLLKPLLCYESSHFSAHIKVTSSDHASH